MSGLHYGLKSQASSALYIIILVIMIQVGRIQELIPGLSSLYLGKVVFGLAALCYLTSSRQHDESLLSFPQVRYILYFFAIGVCAVPGSFWPTHSFEFMFYSFTASLLMIFLIIKLVVYYRDLCKVLWGLVCSLAALGIVAVFFGGTGRASASGTYDPNDLALIMVMFVPLVYFMFQRETGVRKLLLLGVNILMLVTVLATQSRGGFIGLCVVLLLILIRERVSLSRIIFGGVALLLVVSFLSPTGYWERMQTIGSEEDYNKEGGGGRIDIWKRGLTLVRKNPLLGVGPVAFPFAEGTTHMDKATGNSGKWSEAHNTFLQVLAEFGIPGFVIYLMMIFSSIKALRMIRSGLPEESDLLWLTNGLEMSFYGFMATGFFVSQAYSPGFFLLIGLSAAVGVVARNELRIERV